MASMNRDTQAYKYPGRVVYYNGRCDEQSELKIVAHVARAFDCLSDVYRPELLADLLAGATSQGAGRPGISEPV